ncbi:MAG: hypothetical protein WKG07_29030 [Hymenobacter sp.]
MALLGQDGYGELVGVKGKTAEVHVRRPQNAGEGEPARKAGPRRNPRPGAGRQGQSLAPERRRQYPAAATA